MEAESTPHPTLGEFLQNAREKRGMSLEYVADRLKLKISTIKELEANHYEEMGGLVYVKGYLRSYAKLLNANIDQALEVIHTDPSSNHKTTIQGHKAPPHAVEQTTGLWIALALLLLVLVAAFAWHHYTKRKAVHAILPPPAISVVTPAPTPTPVIKTLTPALTLSAPIKLPLPTAPTKDTIKNTTDTTSDPQDLPNDTDGTQNSTVE